MDELVWNPGSSELKPPKVKRHRTPKNDLEGAVLKECVLFLSAAESVIYVERRNTGAVDFEDGGHIAFGRKGAADLWCLISAPCYYMGKDSHGNYEQKSDPTGDITHIEIECKRRDGKGKLSEDQKEFQQSCKDVGIPYFVVTSATDLAEQLINSGLLT